jgi:hypothetical protein
MGAIVLDAADRRAASLESVMPIGSATSAVPPQVLAALAAIQQTQAAELAVATQLEQGFQASTMTLNPALGQLVNLSA